MPSINGNKICILAGAILFTLFLSCLHDASFNLSRRLPLSEVEAKTFHSETNDISPIKFVAKTSDSRKNFVVKTLDFVLTNSKRKEANLPKVAWFLSYPNSGTAYTQTAVQQATQSTVASFYGREFLSVDGIGDSRKQSLLVYEGRDAGPFRVSDQSIPDGGYILSKTHCGGFCSSCMPTVLSPSEFLNECTFGSRVERTDSEAGSRVITTHYDPSIVKKAVHLIRNPFDNIIARFNFEHVLNNINSASSRWKKFYTKDQAGFKEWCQYFDQLNTIEEERDNHLDKELMDVFKNIPCHGEFFRYIQWHNNALNITSSMGIPTHHLHYEEYDMDLDKTVKELVEFLELPIIGQIPKVRTKKYDGYYSADDKKEIESFLKHLSSDLTWKMLSQYMNGLTDESKSPKFSVKKSFD